MEKNILAVMSGLTLLGVGIVVVLSINARPDRYFNNGFARKFESQSPLSLVDTLDIGYDSYYISGQTQHHLYLGNVTAPLHLLIVNIHSLDTQHLQLKLHKRANLQFRDIKLKVDSPSFYIVDGAVPAIFEGPLEQRTANLLDQPGAYFLDLEPMEQRDFAIRSVTRSKKARLGRLTGSPLKVHFAEDVLEIQADGIFCTDGKIHYDTGSRGIVYVYLYRNQYLIMDNELRLLDKWRTIDTFSTARVKVAPITKNNRLVLAAPPIEVNRLSALYDNRLFINSAVPADSEEFELLREQDVIDVYQFRDGKYIKSFYVEHRGERMRDFSVNQTRLIALYEKHLVTYDLAPATDPKLSYTKMQIK